MATNYINTRSSDNTIITDELKIERTYPISSLKQNIKSVEYYMTRGYPSVMFESRTWKTGQLLKALKKQLFIQEEQNKIRTKEKKPQKFKQGLQFVPGGHVFPQDKYRPGKIDLFIKPYPKNHHNTKCTVCGEGGCPNCLPYLLTQKCPGPEDIWPTTKD